MDNGAQKLNGPILERTFQHQGELPSLPVPDLRKTLDKYLDSVSVHLQPKEYERTKRIVDQFECGVGRELHKELLELASKKRNWLEDWWEAHAYHTPRYPIIPLVNFGLTSPFYDAWPPASGVEVERAALATFWMLRYWDLIRKEQLPAQRQRGTPWCMNQVHRLFNTCRIPGEHKDELRYFFKSEYEGSCPSHIVIMDRGLFWRLEILDPSTGDLLTVPQLEAALHEIRKLSLSQQNGIPVGALTCLERTEWWRERQHLIELSPENQRNLNIIEESILMVSFTEEPVTENQLSFKLACPSPICSWADKNIVCQVHENGILSVHSDHSFVDAIVILQMWAYVDEKLKENKFRWNGGPSKSTYPQPEQLRFVTDSRTETAVARAMNTWEKITKDHDSIIWHHTAFGNEFFKRQKIYGDTVIQLAMQLAYFRLHHRPGATYETATTRKFYHGRTETVRSCTPEAVAWAESMLSSGTKGPNRRRLFDIAVEKHNRLMAEAMSGEGCDRHLLGLRILASEKGLPEPELFTDPAWKKSGGDGNFVLSSSLIGYSKVFGGSVAMCADGYGIFYKIEIDRITFYICAWKYGKESDVELFRDSLDCALTGVKRLLDDSSEHVDEISKC